MSRKPNHIPPTPVRDAYTGQVVQKHVTTKVKKKPAPPAVPFGGQMDFFNNKVNQLIQDTYLDLWVQMI